MQFQNRKHAGQVLAGKLRHYGGKSGVVVLALAGRRAGWIRSSAGSRRTVRRVYCQEAGRAGS